MKRLLYFFATAAAVFGVTSCVEPDPAAIYGWNNSGTDFPGPRILEKVSFNNQVEELYTSSAGVVSKVDEYTYDGTAQNDHSVISLTYSGNKISVFDFSSTPTTTSTTTRYKITPTYNNAGKVTSFVKETYTNSVHTGHSIGEYVYDSNNKLTQLTEKTAAVAPNGTVASYSSAMEVNLIYASNNVAKVITISKILNTAGTVVSSASVIEEYSQYDSMPSPYSTLSKDYLSLYGIIAGSKLYRLSDNNHGKYKFINPIVTIPVEMTYQYQYDQQNYPKNNGVSFYSYKPL